MSEELHPASVATAEWWADKLGMATGNGDNTPMGGLVFALAVASGSQGASVEASKRDKFILALAKQITRQLESRVDKPEWPITLGVDYGPDVELAAAADEADVPYGAFPWKTVSWTRTDHVTVSLGYGGKNVLIWQSESWVRPPCSSPKYGEAPEYKRQPWKCSLPRYHDGDCDFSIPQPLCTAIIKGIGSRDRECRRPEENDWHRLDQAWSSSTYHEFTPN